MSYAANLNLAISIVNSLTSDLSSPVENLNLSLSNSLSDGDGDNEFEYLFQVEETLGSGTIRDIVWDNGIYPVEGGSPDTFTKLKMILIQNLSAEYTLKIMEGAESMTTMPFHASGTVADILIPPGGIYFFLAPFAGGIPIAATDGIAIENAGAGFADYRAIILGVS